MDARTTRAPNRRRPAARKDSGTKDVPSPPKAPTVMPMLDAALQHDPRAPHQLDRMIHSQLAKVTRGLSPETVANAMQDWVQHLALAPGKQQELAQKAWRKSARLSLYAMGATQGEVADCIDPLPQDRRFAAPEWRQWPYNLMQQSFLLAQQWWHNATTDVRGMTNHHEQIVTFAVRQMLDMVSPSNALWTNPVAQAATFREGGMNLVRGAQHAWEDALRALAGRPPEGAERFRPGHEVAVTPGKVVLRNRLIELIQYAPSTPTVRAEPLLIVPSWIMKYYILDLSPHNSLVKWLVDQGYTVFCLSWKNPDSDDRDVGMDDYLKLGVLAAVDAVSRIVPGRGIHAIGYCLGGTLLAMAAAALARDGDTRLKSLSLLAAQLDFSEPGELSLFIDESQIAYLEDTMWDLGYLDGRQMSGAFQMLNSRDLVWSRWVHEVLMGERAPLTDLMAWNADATRMPYRQHSEYLRSLYLHNDLAEGRYKVDGRSIALTDIRIPTFAVGTQRDTVSPWRSTFKVHLLTDGEVTYCLSSGGHNVGVVNPPGPGVPRSHQVATRGADERWVDPDTWAGSTPVHEGSWWPAFEAWLARRAGDRVPPPPMGAPQAGLPALDGAPGRYVLMT